MGRSHVAVNPRQSRLKSGTLWFLRAAFAIRCWAIGDAYLWNPLERDSEIFEVLMFNLGLEERVAMLIENTGMWITFVAGLVVVLRPWLESASTDPLRRRAAGRNLEKGLLLFCVVWELVLALAMTFRGGSFLSQASLACHALRIGIPLALLVAGRSEGYALGVETILRVATTATFVAHGLAAWWQSPTFTTLLLGSWENIVGTRMSQAAAEAHLRIIGGVDFVLALLLIVRRWPWVGIYMGFWGFITALSRLPANGWYGYPEVLLRAAHVGGPLALAWHWSKRCTREGHKEV